MSDAAHARTLTIAEAQSRSTGLRDLARRDTLGAFEGALDLLGELVLAAAACETESDPRTSALAPPAAAARSLVARLLRDDARRREHEIDRESAWYVLFDTWLDDEGGLLDGFGGYLVQNATLPSDRRILRRLAADELASLPLVFPLGAADDLRRVVLTAARTRLEALGVALRLRDDDGTPDRDKNQGESSARSQRRALETEFLRDPTEGAFLALKAVVPHEQWGAVRERLLGHLQKHQKAPSLVFKLYWDEGLVIDADGLVVTQAVDPDVLAGAAMELKDRQPIVAAGWLLVSACRLADSFPRSRWPDVVRHLVLVRDLSRERDGEDEFHRVLRSFRFRHAESPELLSRLAEVGL